MPAQLGQHPRLNLSGYVPGKQNPLGQELLAGVLGQVIGNYMRPDYSGELAERGIEDPRNKVQKVLGVRPTDQAVSQMMGNVTAEQRTADTGRKDLANDGSANGSHNASRRDSSGRRIWYGRMDGTVEASVESESQSID